VKIQSTALGLLKAPLRIPFKTALRTVTELEEITVQLLDNDGFVGWGSVVPTPAITGDTEERIRTDLAFTLALLRRTEIDDVWNWKSILPEGHTISRSAQCAIDVALHDMAARKANQPLWKWLGGYHWIVMNTNMTISVDTPAVMAQRASEAARAGFKSLKVKVGLNAELDKSRVLAIRNAIGEKISLRLDANQGWTEAEASALIPWFAEMCGPIDFIEQPVRADALAAMSRLTRHSPVPIVADESAMTLEQAKKILEERAAHALSVKLIKAGGVAEARAILDLAFAEKIPCLMSCMFEVGAGLQAAVHLASIHPSVHWVDLDSAEFLSQLPYQGGVKFNGPEIRCSDGPGLDVNLSGSLSRSAVL
jgi:L-alanine-DL-glutamate epimerase-like enolase superfamily enzyme